MSAAEKAECLLVPPPIPKATIAPRRAPLLEVDTPPSARPYLLICSAAALLGVIAVVLFWQAPGVGLNLLLACLAGAGAIAALSHQIRGRVPARVAALLFACILFAALFVVRASAPLATMNVLLVVLFGGLAVSPGFAHKGQVLISRAMAALQQSFANALTGAFRLWRELPWHFVSGFVNLRGLWSVVRGVFIALPLLLVFGMLFRSADVRFDNLISDVFQAFFTNIFAVMAWFAVGAWVAGGVLRQAILGRAAEQGLRTGAAPASLRVSPTEATVCLVLLNLLFLAFVSLQVPYLFGGLRHVAAEPGMTLADYARRGFFELATVAALVLPMLLAADWLLDPASSPRQVRVFRVACAVLVGLLAIIMASALQRMVIYMQQYGLTQLRLFVSAFILMLAMVFVWFTLTVLRGKRQHFLAGALVIGAAFSAALQLANPDARIAQYNLQRAREGKECDLEYIARLSPDAWPAIVKELQHGGIPQAEELMKQLRERWQWQDKNWQNWNWSYSRGAEALRHVR